MLTTTLISLSASPPPRVAVVGCGIAGAATAHFLLELRPDLEIDCFESSSGIGGRAHTLPASEFGVPLDAGATSIFSGNHYLTSFVEAFNLTKAADSGKDVIGLWDGAEFRFHWGTGILLPAHLIARYGLSPVRVVSSVKRAVSNLNRIYELQAQNVSYASPSDMFDALELTNLTQVSAYDYLERTLRITPTFVEEFVDGASRDNYGQSGAINALVDLVSLAGAGIAGSVFSLRDGTTPIVANLLASPRITTHTSSPVTSVEALDTSFRLRYADTAAGAAAEGGGARAAATVREGEYDAEYDAVAVATPLENSRGLTLLRPVGGRLNTSRPYQRTCVTFVCGSVNARYFGLGALEKMPTEVITTENASLPFTTLAVHATLPNGSHVYKLFSRAPLADATLDAVFTSRSRVRRLDWTHAYPQLLPTPARTTWPPFEVALEPAAHGDDGRRRVAPPRSVVYVSAMESPVSCMETQLIAAKNAALRLHAQLQARARR